MNEAVWVSKWVREESAEDFLARNRIAAFRLSFAITGDRSLAEDATQEAMVRAVKGWAKRKDKSATVAWWRRIVVNCSIRACAKPHHFGLDDQLHTADAECQDTVIAVRTILLELSPDHRAILALSEFEGLTYREMAEALDIPEGTVASRLNSAKSAFRKLWEDK